MLYSFKGKANRKVQSPALSPSAFWPGEKAGVARPIDCASLSSVGFGSGLYTEADSDPALLRTSGI